jgi:adenosylcobinamide kinase/adenosylcobinamide-phosphate guanylyltransferase
MNEITFVIGGCRSGKSRHALDLAKRTSMGNMYFFATCEPHDEEMKQRIKLHKDLRGSSWQTKETPILLPETITEYSHNAGVIIVDCLTLWISNLLLKTDDQEKVFEYVQDLLTALENSKCPVILVSNEVGAGIVPENRLARLFRDLAGFTNQKVAKVADKVIFMAAGIPVAIKEG